MLLKCGYTQQYERERMDFLDSLTDRIYVKGNLTPKQINELIVCTNNLTKNYCHKMQKSACFVWYFK